MTYHEKTEKIGEDEREFVREKLAQLAERLRKRYPNMNYKEINRNLHQILDVSV